MTSIFEKSNLKQQSEILVVNAPSTFEPAFNRDTGWDVMRSAGFDTVRQVAIDEDWSALRFRRQEHISVRG